MEYLKYLLFDLSMERIDYNDLLVKFLFFVAGWIFILYALYLIFSKIIKPEKHRGFQLRLAFLWALATFQLLFSIYLFFLIRWEGLADLKWDVPRFYLIFSPQLFIFFGTIIWFVIQHNKLNSFVKPRMK